MGNKNVPLERMILDTLQRRIMAHAEWVGSCLEWQGAHNVRGYGKIKIPGTRRTIYTHRAMLMAAGHDLCGKEACHRCDNPRCVNPDHLFAGTRIDNHKDSVAKGRAKNPPPKKDWPAIVQAGDHHNQKLTVADVQAIRARLSNGERQIDVRREYGLSSSHMTAIAKRRRWAHI